MRRLVCLVAKPILVVAFLALTAKGNQAVDFLGVGYNILTNDFDYQDSGSLVNNQPILLPAPNQIITGENAETCLSERTPSYVYEGTLSYQTKILESVHLSDASKTLFEGFKFSKTKSYNTVSAYTTDDDRVLHQRRADCTLEDASLISTDGVLLSEDFINDVFLLPTTYNERDYVDFINSWGTDIITGIKLGLKSHNVTQTSHVSVVKQAVKDKQFTANNDVVVIDMDKIRRNLTSHSDIFTDFVERESVGTPGQLALIELTLTSISAAFDEQFWDNVEHDPTALAARRMNLFIALNIYPSWMGAIQSFNPVVQANITWPMGVYSLPMVKTQPECPNTAFTWSTGFRYQDTQDLLASNSWSKPYHLKGPYDDSYVQTNFCTKTNMREDSNDWDWMPGQYCIYRKKDICPAGFQSGFVIWDDDDIWNRNTFDGVLPDGVYDEDDSTQIYFCCRDDGSVNESILLPTKDPFVLIQKTEECQQVHGMSVSAEWFHYDGNDSLFGRFKEYFGGSHPYNSGRDNDHVLHYCYYE